jgi:hypothetical protein
MYHARPPSREEAGDESLRRAPGASQQQSSPTNSATRYTSITPGQHYDEPISASAAYDPNSKSYQQPPQTSPTRYSTHPAPLPISPSRIGGQPTQNGFGNSRDKPPSTYYDPTSDQGDANPSRGSSSVYKPSPMQPQMVSYPSPPVARLCDIRTWN